MDYSDDLKTMKQKTNTTYSNSDFYFSKKTTLKTFSLTPEKTLSEKDYANINYFIKRIDDVYTSPKSRVDEEVWRELLSNPMVDSMEYGLYFKKEVLNYFTKHYYLPDKIWDLIDVLFCFSTDYSQEIDDYAYSIMLFSLIHNLENLSPLSYEYITNIDPELFDIYISYREIVYKDLKCGNFNDASINLDLAYDICDYDPELIRLNGDYFYLTQNFEDAVPFYKKCLNLNNQDYTAIERLGKCLYKLDKYHEALQYLLQYIDKYQQKYDIILLIAMCYYRTDNFIKAKEYFDILLTKNLKYKCLEPYEKNITKHLKRKSFKKSIIDDFDYTLPIEDSPKFKYMFPDGYVTVNPRPAFSVNNVALVLLLIITVATIIFLMLAFSQSLK